MTRHTNARAYTLADTRAATRAYYVAHKEERRAYICVYDAAHQEERRAYGLRQARYRGKAKVRLQNYLIGAACNIRRLFRRLAWEALQARGVDSTVQWAIAG